MIEYLHKRKIEINTDFSNESLDMPRLRKGLIRISFHEEITEQDIRILANEIIKGIQLQITKAEWDESKI